MIDLCLKFENKAHAESILVEAEVGIVGEEENSFVPNSGFAVDVIGKLYKHSLETETYTDMDGNEYTVPKMEELDGWHVNVRCMEIVPSALQQYKVEPKSPMRVWA